MRELGKLTDGERLVLDRRRRSESQTEAAQRYGVTRQLYSQWELDEVGPPLTYPTGRLADHEVVFLYRRRAKFSRNRVAQEVGCSPFWVTQMERGRQPCDRLLEYWEC